MERRSTMPMDIPNPAAGIRRRASARYRNGAARTNRTLPNFTEDFTSTTNESCFLQLWNCMKGSSKYRDLKLLATAGGSNSVSNIDQLARVMFPMAFSGFHLFYWLTYLGPRTMEAMWHK